MSSPTPEDLVAASSWKDASSVTTHRRKSSKGEGDDIVTSMSAEFPRISDPPSRMRIKSTPTQYNSHVRQASLSVTPPLFPMPRTTANLYQPSSVHTPFSIPIPNGHTRGRSISSYSPPSPSPLSASFPQSAAPSLSTFPLSPLSPSFSSNTSGMAASTSSGPEARRHARLHSRNLSVFFPRPGMNAMSEDDDRPEAPVSTIPSAGSSVRIPGSKPPITPLGANFTFGTRPPSLVLERQQAASPLPPLMGSKTGPSTPSRRGHHHKHSVSHNFFSFLEPGASSAPATGGFSMDRATQTASPRAQVPSPVTPSPFTDTEVPGALVGATSMAGAQFLLGAWLWVAGQQVGSLACAGLGYWVVFDAFGVGIASVLPCYLRTQKQDKARRYYGNARIWTVAMFAQAVYLMFASVYVCKEAVEHLLLSTGDADEGHHHHHVVDDGDDSALQIDFPLFLIFLTLFTVSTTALLFNNHSKLINIVGNRIPHPQSLLHRRSSQSSEVPPDSTIGLIVSNPYVLLPLMFSIGILFVALFVDPSVHMMCDLVIAMMIAGSTFHVAYAASVTLGSVLLQTSPARGLPGGKMEAFLRAMREVERHPQVLHLPAPHIWQLTPTLAGKSIPPGGEYYADPEYSELVVTMELHVKDDLPDDDVLRLTRWAWERCVHALGSRGKGHGDEPDVTVSVVRG